MDPEPSGLLIFLQIILIFFCALLSAVESAAQQLNLLRRRVPDDEDDQTVSLIEKAGKLLQAPSGIRICLQMTALMISGLAVWAFALPLAGLASNVWGWSFISREGLAVLFGLLVLLTLTFLIQLFGILLPRRIAAQKPRTTAKLLFPLASFVSLLFRPLSYVLDKLTNAVLRLFRVEMLQPSEEITEDEIRMLVDVGEEKGTIEEAEREMIKNVFEFNNMIAAECMTHRTDMRTIWTGDTKEEIVSLINETGLSRFPVYEEDLDHIIGTVSTRDFLLNLQLQQPKPLSGIIREAHFVPESVRTDLLFRDMQRNKFHMAIVVDEYGGTSGLITMEDLLEEIVGNIYDEYDPQDKQEFEVLEDGRWRVAGTLDVEAFNEKTGRDLPLDEEYDTIGGLILSQVSSIPESGSGLEIDCGGLHFKVESMEGRRIASVEVSVKNDL